MAGGVVRWCVVLICCFVVNVSGTEYFMTAGGCSPPVCLCSSGQPCKDLYWAVSKATSSGDIISVAAGAYQLQVMNVDIATDITIRGTGAAGTSVFSCAAIDRLVTISSSGVTLENLVFGNCERNALAVKGGSSLSGIVLNDLILQDMDRTSAGASDEGAGLSVFDATVVANDLIVRRCLAKEEESGAGIYVSGGHLTLNRPVVEDCGIPQSKASRVAGGCIGVLDSTLIVNDGSLSDCVASAMSGITQFKVTASGGCIDAEDSTLEIRGSNFSNCAAVAWDSDTVGYDSYAEGGAVAFRVVSPPSSIPTLLIDDCRFDSCLARGRSEGRGGAVFITRPFTTDPSKRVVAILSEVRVNNATAYSEGGALFADETNLTLSDVDISHSGVPWSVSRANVFRGGGVAVADNATVTVVRLNVWNCSVFATSELPALPLSVTASGGCIDCLNSWFVGTQVSLIDCTVSAWDSESHAGVYDSIGQGGALAFSIDFDVSPPVPALSLANITILRAIAKGRTQGTGGGLFIARPATLDEEKRISATLSNVSIWESVSFSSGGSIFAKETKLTMSDFAVGDGRIDKSDTRADELRGGCVALTSHADTSLSRGTIVMCSIQGFTSALPVDVDLFGGCVGADQSFLSIEDVSVADCHLHASDDGTIALDSWAHGGALSFTMKLLVTPRPELTLRRVAISNSSAFGRSAGLGGGVHVDRSDTVIPENRLRVVLDGLTVTNCSADSEGGKTVPTVQHPFIGAAGGGIHVRLTIVQMMNSSISFNRLNVSASVTEKGGGLYVVDSNFTVVGDLNRIESNSNAGSDGSAFWAVASRVENLPRIYIENQNISDFQFQASFCDYGKVLPRLCSDQHVCLVEGVYSSWALVIEDDVSWQGAACVACPEGYYSLNDRRTCEKCAPGSFWNATNIPHIACFDCPEQYYAPFSGSEECDFCIPPRNVTNGRTDCAFDDCSEPVAPLDCFACAFLHTMYPSIKVDSNFEYDLRYRPKFDWRSIGDGSWLGHKIAFPFPSVPTAMDGAGETVFVASPLQQRLYIYQYQGCERDPLNGGFVPVLPPIEYFGGQTDMDMFGAAVSVSGEGTAAVVGAPACFVDFGDGLSPYADSPMPALPASGSVTFYSSSVHQSHNATLKSWMQVFRLSGSDVDDALSSLTWPTDVTARNCVCFGKSVVLSDDGTVMVVGAHGLVLLIELHTMDNIDRIFQGLEPVYTPNSWDNPIAPYIRNVRRLFSKTPNDLDDGFGFALALTPDGRRIAVSSVQSFLPKLIWDGFKDVFDLDSEEGRRTNSGRVDVFQKMVIERFVDPYPPEGESMVSYRYEYRWIQSMMPPPTVRTEGFGISIGFALLGKYLSVGAPGILETIKNQKYSLLTQVCSSSSNNSLFLYIGTEEWVSAENVSVSWQLQSVLSAAELVDNPALIEGAWAYMPKFVRGACNNSIQAGTGFGWSVSMFGAASAILVGAPGVFLNDSEFVGSVYLFRAADFEPPPAPETPVEDDDFSIVNGSLSLNRNLTYTFSHNATFLPYLMGDDVRYGLSVVAALYGTRSVHLTSRRSLSSAIDPIFRDKKLPQFSQVDAHHCSAQKCATDAYDPNKGCAVCAVGYATSGFTCVPQCEGIGCVVGTCVAPNVCTCKPYFDPATGCSQCLDGYKYSQGMCRQSFKYDSIYKLVSLVLVMGSSLSAPIAASFFRIVSNAQYFAVLQQIAVDLPNDFFSVGRAVEWTNFQFDLPFELFVDNDEPSNAKFSRSVHSMNQYAEYTGTQENLMFPSTFFWVFVVCAIVICSWSVFLQVVYTPIVFLRQFTPQRYRTFYFTCQAMSRDVLVFPFVTGYFGLSVSSSWHVTLIDELSRSAPHVVVYVAAWLVLFGFVIGFPVFLASLGAAKEMASYTPIFSFLTQKPSWVVKDFRPFRSNYFVWVMTQRGLVGICIGLLSSVPYVQLSLICAIFLVSVISLAFTLPYSSVLKNVTEVFAMLICFGLFGLCFFFARWSEGDSYRAIFITLVILCSLSFFVQIVLMFVNALAAFGSASKSAVATVRGKYHSRQVKSKFKKLKEERDEEEAVEMESLSEASSLASEESEHTGDSTWIDGEEEQVVLVNNI